MSSSDYERGYSAGYRAAERKYKTRNTESVEEINVPLTIKEKAYAACNAAVEECHRIEREIGFPSWALRYDGGIVEIPRKEWPQEYIIARDNWERLRKERDQVYAQGVV